jgi:phosphoenolpyruvate-protein kinase (PTS system EI component)
LPALLTAGVRSLSIAPAALARVKAQIARFGGAIGG